MMDKELLERFFAEITRRKWTVEQAAETINVGRSTLFHWQKTGRISKRGRFAMAAFIPGEKSPAPTCAPDPFMQIITTNWNLLTAEERGRVAGVVLDMVERKKTAPADESPDAADGRISEGVKNA